MIRTGGATHCLPSWFRQFASVHAYWCLRNRRTDREVKMFKPLMLFVPSLLILAAGPSFGQALRATDSDVIVLLPLASHDSLDTSAMVRYFKDHTVRIISSYRRVSTASHARKGREKCAHHHHACGVERAPASWRRTGSVHVPGRASAPIDQRRKLLSVHAGKPDARTRPPHCTGIPCVSASSSSIHQMWSHP